MTNAVLLAVCSVLVAFGILIIDLVRRNRLFARLVGKSGSDQYLWRRARDEQQVPLNPEALWNN